MRQTSQAVLLLISSAAAVNPAVNFPLALNTGTVAARTIITQGAIAVPYFGKPVYGFETVPKVDTGTNKAIRIAAIAVGVSSDNAGAFTTDPGTSCVGCMNNRTSATTGVPLGVWCSAAWNYEYTGLVATAAYPTAKLSNTRSGLTYDPLGAWNGTAGVDDHKGDQGACCYTQAVWEVVSKILTAGQGGGNTTKANLLNKFTCPAKFSSAWVAVGDQNITANLTMQTTNWWCSDGSYNLKADALYGTLGATASNLKGTVANFEAATATTKNEMLPLNDKRLELMMAACRQKKVNCGGSSMILTTETGADAMTRTVLTTAGMTSLEKCTWTLMSTTKAPSFKISGGAVALTANWDVMYQEWVDGWQVSEKVDFMPMITSATAANVRTMNGVIYPHLLGAVYAKAAKYNYPTITSGNQAADISANGQRSGMAYTLVNPTAVACALAATYVQSPANCVENYKTRWFTASDANAGTVGASANMATFTGKLGTFNTAATAYNTYLADLKTANEKDAFAAFFAPPTKPAFVKRPATPWVPAAYTGLQHWTAANQQNFWDKKASSAPGPNEYVLGNMPSAAANDGGWGNWTIQRFNAGTVLMNANFIWHSFGMVGTTAAPSNNMSGYIKNWNQITETNLGGGNTLANFRLSTSTAGSVMCATANGTAVNDKCLKLDAAVGTKTIANVKNVYLSVSIWAAKTMWEAEMEAAAAFPAAGFKISFMASDWGSGSDYYAPAAAGTPTALTEPAAAQALAASAAAVLAVAAALY